MLEQEAFQLVILHLDGPASVGAALLDRLRRRRATEVIPLLAIGEAAAELPAQAIRLPAAVSHAELLRAIEAALDRSPAPASA